MLYTGQLLVHPVCLVIFHSECFLCSFILFSLQIYVNGKNKVMMMRRRRRRIGIASSAMNRLDMFWRDRHISNTTKFRIYSCCIIVLVLLYGCETWTLTSIGWRKLEALAGFPKISTKEFWLLTTMLRSVVNYTRNQYKYVQQGYTKVS